MRREWFPEFVQKLIDGVPRQDWPDIDSEFWRIMERAFARDGISEFEAFEALDAVAPRPPMYLDRWTESLLIEVRRIREQSRPPGERDRDSVRAECRQCAECGGEGLTSRAGWRRYPLNDDGSRRDPAGHWVTVSCYCPCNAGRWIKAQHAGDESLRGRIIDLTERPDLAKNPRTIPREYLPPPSQPPKPKPKPAPQFVPSPEPLSASPEI
jgi:hypothetical protein